MNTVNLKKKKGVFDADDNLVITHLHLLRVLVQEFGRPVDEAGNPCTMSEEDVLRKHHGCMAKYWEGQSVHPKVKAKAKKLMNDNCFQGEIPFFDGSVAVVAATAERFSPVCATARGEELREGTTASFAQAGISFDDLVMRDPRWTFDKGSEWKARWLLEQGDEVAFIMDDSHSIIPPLLEGGFKGVIVLFQPRAEVSAHPQVKVCYNWAEAGEIIRQIPD